VCYQQLSRQLLPILNRNARTWSNKGAQKWKSKEESKNRLDNEATTIIGQIQKAVEATGHGQLEKARAATRN
jgi:hypothetical protein